MNNNVTFQINFAGNANRVVNNVTSGVSNLKKVVGQTIPTFAKLGGKIMMFNQMAQSVQGVAQGLGDISRPGMELNSTLADLSAITGQTGEGLKRIETNARDLAKTFGGRAADSVESFKLVLSKLNPEIAQSPKALKAMGEHIAILSKTMGGDTRAATEVLTTAMNQFQVSTEDPIAASKKMAEMMNVMAAGAKEGSAELPQIKAALEQTGMAAKAAGVSFEEANAAIQVLDKAGKKGSEGGVALRNVMATLSQGRFLPKRTLEELSQAGVNTSELTDKTLTLSERLRSLQPIMQDDAMLTKLFGKENSNAALALLSGVDAMDGYTKKITGTSTATEQAATVMESYQEKVNRARARMEDLKISMFNATGSFMPFASVVSEALVPLGQIAPLFMAVGSAVRFVAGNIGVMIGGIGKSINWFARMGRVFRLQMAFMKADLVSTSMVSKGFRGNMIRATLAVVRFGTVGIFQALKGLGALVLSLITGGATSAAFAATATASFTAFKISAVGAFRAVSVAIMNVPIIGWIAAIIAGLIALGVYFYKTSAKFRAVLAGTWAVIKTFFTGIFKMAKNIFGAVVKIIKGAFTLDLSLMKEGLGDVKKTFTDFGKQAGSAFSNAYEKSMEKSRRAEREEAEKDKDVDFKPGNLPDYTNQNTDENQNENAGKDSIIPTNPVGDGIKNIAKSSNITGGGAQVKQTRINIENLIGENTNMFREGETIDDAHEFMDKLTNAMQLAVNDVNNG